MKMMLKWQEHFIYMNQSIKNMVIDCMQKSS